MLGYFGGYYDTWNAGHKVTFDAKNKLVLINYGVIFLDAQDDIYSAWKEWAKFKETKNTRRYPAIVAVGGNSTSPTEKLGSSFFMSDGWRIKPWVGHKSITIVGNVFTTEADRPIVPDDNGTDAVSLNLSSITTTTVIDNTPQSDTIAPTWDGAVGIISSQQVGSFINIGWGSASDASAVSYNIYISQSLEALFTNASKLGRYSSNSLTIATEGDGITPLTENNYYVAIRAIDSFDNETTNVNYMIVNYVPINIIQDVNIVSVTGTPVTDIGDFNPGSVDISGIPQAVWEYVSRDLTTAEFNANIIKVNGITANSINDFKADVSNLSADVNIVEVNGVTVTSIDEFKANLTSIDLSNIPKAVWSYVTRELTVAAGLTPEQEARLNAVPTAQENAAEIFDGITIP